ncbi:outer membrane lipoprotein carrier protein LolA [Cohnella lubricantis]|uniref:Outer membrane lipoprotein carrier protein LolA n=1 Tax=Cohnella lubricantis TaxID=2163172 RepID=A0A841TDL2_9BACL|nr:outer membrane lipoprotein carrier protein LolA [Cohnella lubricantis]MBB6677067.1 outer membrane lipoprotein carrier protein LolA [Cohnella lubricantis]MBP2118914.1 outer membrane lipoprotein-sorting protein [Cohnella lubricantis]
MLRRIPWIASVVVLFVAVLSACGGKNSDSVVKDLSKVSDNLESYQGSGEMILHTGQTPLTYKVEVWYQKPNYYRIALTSAERDITQIVLKNDQGVYVLTPQLKKSYRFQSDWPDNQGQVYLYQTLLRSISIDNSRQFTTDKDAYVFDVMASNYNNGSFARQKIWLDKDDYAPKQVQVTDTNAQLMVEVKFTDFKFGTKFDKSAFDMKQNMDGASGTGSAGNASGQTDGTASETPSGTNGDTPSGTDGDTPSGSDGGTDTTTGGIDDQAEGMADGQGMVPIDFVAVEPDPDALPEGVSLHDNQDIYDEAGVLNGVMYRYTGTYDFTIVETTQRDVKDSIMSGRGFDLGFTLGQMFGVDTQTVTWTYDGVEYRLTTADLPDDAIVKIAQSMVASSGK